MVSLENLMLVLSTAISGILMLIGGIIIFSYAKKKRYRLVYLFSINWILQSSVWFLVSLAHFYYSTTLMAIAFVPQCLGIFILLIFLELIEKERINSLKMIMVAIIETLYIVFTFLPGSMEVIPNYGVHIIGLCRFFQIITLLIYFFLYFLWSFKTWQKAPLEMKPLARLLLLGSLLFSIVALSMYMLGSVIKVFNPIGFIIHSIGALITIIVIRRDPKIIYILPFKAFKLLVIETTQGLSLFSYEWVKQDVKKDDWIFSSIFQGIGNLLKDVLNKGEIREIQLEQAILFIKHNVSYPVASVLIASKTSKSLRNGLEQFNDQFIAKFSESLETANYISQFSGAVEIVKKVFEFVPEYN